MDLSLFTKLGIDWKHLIAQLVNFGIVFVALWIFLYKPVTKMLSARKKKIADGLDQVVEADKKVAAAKQQAAQEQERARLEANELLQQLKARQETEYKRVLAEGRDKVNAEYLASRDEIKKEREQLFEDVKKKTAILSVEIARQIVKKEIDAKEHARLIEGAISKL